MGGGFFPCGGDLPDPFFRQFAWSEPRGWPVQELRARIAGGQLQHLLRAPRGCFLSALAPLPCHPQGAAFSRRSACFHLPADPGGVFRRHIPGFVQQPVPVGLDANLRLRCHASLSREGRASPGAFSEEATRPPGAPTG